MNLKRMFGRREPVRASLKKCGNLIELRCGSWGKLQATHKKDEIFLGELFVEPKYRRRGVASLLLDEVERIAIAGGVNVIRGNLTRSDLAACDRLASMFEGRGFQITAPFDGFAVHGIEKYLK